MKTFNEFVDIAEKVSQSPKPTLLPRSRERNIGRHDDWKDPHPDTRDFGVKPPAAQKLKSRLNAVVGTQRRQDKETKVTNEDAQQFMEQTPTMEPNLYSQLVARRQVAQKSAHIKHVHSELGAEARAQQAAKHARLKAIMSR